MSQSQFTQPTQGQSGQQRQYQSSPSGGQGQQSSGGGGQSSMGSAQPGQLFPTQNYLREDVRAPVAEMLNRVLADTTILFTHAKFAHWNVKGMQFYSLHLLFDEIAEVFERHVDEIGERITALGAQAMGTAGMAVSNCSLPSMPTDAVTGEQYVQLLADRLAFHDANLYDAIHRAEDLGDPDTADLLNEVSREVTEQLYFLEAHLQTQPTGTISSSGSAGQGRGQRSQREQPSGDQQTGQQSEWQEPSAGDASSPQPRAGQRGMQSGQPQQWSTGGSPRSGPQQSEIGQTGPIQGQAQQPYRG